MVALETELYRLARLDAAIPAQVGGGVRIAAGDCGIPGAGQGGAIGVFPTDVPAVDGAGAVIGNTDCTGKA